MLHWRVIVHHRLVAPPTRHASFNRGIQQSLRVHTRRHFHDSRVVRENDNDPADRIAKHLIDAHPGRSNDFIQSIDAIRPVPKNNTAAHVLPNDKYDSLLTQLSKSFTVPQLREYLEQAQQKRVPKQTRKQHMIEAIVHELWGFSSKEMVRQAAIRKQADMTQHYCKANRQELFFIIGDNGDNVRQIEQKYDVRITVLANMSQYMIEGHTNAVALARHEIKQYLSAIVNDHLSVPPLKAGVDIQDLFSSIRSLLPYISKDTMSFITIEDGKFALSARSKDAIQYAKWTLAKTMADLDLTTTRPLGLADDLYIQLWGEKSDLANLSFTPVHDASAMPVAIKSAGWSRVNMFQTASSEEPKGLYHLSRDEQAKWVDNGAVERAILAKLPETINANIHLEARFGNVLFENPANTAMPFLMPSLNQHFTAQALHEHIVTSTDRHIFFASQPPRDITASLLPMLNDGISHFQRRVVLDYVSKSLLPGLAKDAHALREDTLKRLQIEFLIHGDGDLALERVTGEYNRAAIDVIGLERNVDLRFLARQYVLFADDTQAIPSHLVCEQIPDELQKAVERCELTGYSDCECLPSLDLGSKGSMDLLSVSFKNDARYTVEGEGSDVMVTVSDVDTQQDQTRHTELTVTPIEHDPTAASWTVPRNGLDKWPAIRNTVQELGKRWKFSFFE